MFVARFNELLGSQVFPTTTDKPLFLKGHQ